MSQNEKLKPEHRKLWRRVYFYEFEELRHTAEDSAAMADRVVAQWERRGAFDEDGPLAAPNNTIESASRTNDKSPYEQFVVRFPNAAIIVLDEIDRFGLQKHLKQAPCDDRESFAVSALTPYGTYLLFVGYKEGVNAMRRAMGST